MTNQPKSSIDVYLVHDESLDLRYAKVFPTYEQASYHVENHDEEERENLKIVRIPFYYFQKD